MATPTRPPKILQRINIQSRGRQFQQLDLVLRQAIRQVPQAEVAFDPQRLGIQAPRQNERRAGTDTDATGDHGASRRSPARDQSRDIAAIEPRQIDRQDQHGGAVARPQQAASDGRRQSPGAMAARGEVHAVAA